MDSTEHTLLVVDDNQENRDLLSRRLRKRGFAVLTAEDGQRALEIVETQQVDLVLLDVMMPGLDGLQVLKILRERPATAELPVIMATAKSESEDIVEALELGANDYVTKPLDFPVVLARVQAQLRARRAVRRVEQVDVETAAAEVRPGVVLADRYRLEAKIGAGNFGTVYQATHLDLDRRVAVKVLQSSLGSGSEAVARFRREGVAACRVRHPNAVSILDFGMTAQGLAFLVMELLEGRSLDEELADEGVLSPRRCAEIMIPVCDALAEAHRSGIVHRDVKPSNVFLHRTPQGEVPKVLDFGIAKIVGEAALAQKLTVEGWVLGTPVYMAPERFRSQGYDGKPDVYSLGVMLYEMLVGRLPFVPPPDDPMAVIAMHTSRAPTPPSRLNPAVPETLERLVLQALKKRPENRPTAAELADGLARAADLERVAAKPESGPPSEGGALDRTKGWQGSAGDVSAATLPTPIPATDSRPTQDEVGSPPGEDPQAPGNRDH